MPRCRFLCPIGGQNALFSKLACTEQRARKGVCSATCSSYHCIKGGPAEPPLGLQTSGCPMGAHPGNLGNNTDCIVCFSCAAACPHSSVEFKLRPLAADLWSFAHEESVPELLLMFLLLGAVGVHHLPQVAAQLGLSAEFIAEQLTPHEGLRPSFFGVHALASAALLAAPAGLVWGVDALWGSAALAAMASAAGSAARSFTASPSVSAAATPASAALAPAAASSSSQSSLLSPASPPSSPPDARSSAPLTTQGLLSRLPPRLTRIAYAYLPLTWAATLAHYEDWGLREAGTVARVLARSLEDDGLLPPSIAELVPAPVADPAVVAFVQGATLVAGAAGSAALARRLGARPWVQLTPHLAGIALVTAELWSLLVAE